jgi:hypothetical protein
MTNLAESGAVPRAIDARDWLPDLAAFIIGLALTWGFHWQVPDLVWSLWLSSFVIGYVTILITIARGAGKITGVGRQEGASIPIWFKGATAVGALFLLAFFTVHFGGFHFVHSVFLNLFFPVQGEGSFAGFRHQGGSGFPNAQLYLTVLGRYWPFLLASIIAERRNLLAPPASLDFAQPYRNVIRLHLLIFFFFFAAVLHLESFLVYAVVFAVYFFPFRMFRTKAKKPQTK